jgi:hypothetical protein
MESWKLDFLPFLVTNQCNEMLNKILKSLIEKDILYMYEKRDNIKFFSIQAYIKDDFYVRRINNINDYKQCNFDCID